MGAPESMCGDQGVLEPADASGVWDIIKITIWIWYPIVDCGRDDSVIQGESSRNRLKNPAGCKWLSDHRLECVGFCQVIILHGVTVGIDVINVIYLQPAALKSDLNRVD